MSLAYKHVCQPPPISFSEKVAMLAFANPCNTHTQSLIPIISHIWLFRHLKHNSHSQVIGLPSSLQCSLFASPWVSLPPLCFVCPSILVLLLGIAQKPNRHCTSSASRCVGVSVFASGLISCHNCMQQWSSGRIHRCHRCDPGSIPG